MRFYSFTVFHHSIPISYKMFFFVGEVYLDVNSFEALSYCLHPDHFWSGLSIFLRYAEICFTIFIWFHVFSNQYTYLENSYTMVIPEADQH